MNSEYIKKIRTQLGITQKELAEKIGVSLKTITNYETGGVIPISKQKLLNSLYDNIDSEPLFKRVSNAQIVDEIQFMNIPFVPIPAQGGYGKGYGDPEYISALPTFPVIVDKNYRGKYRVFEVEGDSMDDGSRQSLYDGDKILCREVKPELWKSKLHIKDWFFVICMKNDGITVKQITEHDVEGCKIKCHPLNPIFEDFEVDLREVGELYNVIKIVDRNARI